jgi:hypothetical protein
MRSTLLTIAIAAAAQLALAQDRTASGAQDTVSTQTGATAQANEEQATPRRSIKVLQHPYDLASFYRSGGSAPEGWAGLTNDPSYGIASFYRSQGGSPSRYGWSAFWTSGYGAPRPAPFLGYRRTIGENGDLFLVVPFLAPVGPITGAFFGY